MTLGVLGTLVWDRIDHPSAGRVERWGGIAYSLAAAAAAAPEGWGIRPLVKVGADLSGPARRFLASLPLAGDRGIVEVPEPNNRVHLRYLDAEHRDEHLTGGVPGWSMAELEPLLEGVDALYVNLISGFELDLGTAAGLRRVTPGPVYADLHSLLLAVGEDGRRTPRRLARRAEWLAAFDLVQVNERELTLVAGDDDPAAVAETAVADGLTALFVTRGAGGASWVAAGEGPRPWATGPTPGRPAVRGSAGVSTARGDPTGCGDVWGATCFVELLRGKPVPDAVREANDAASRNLDHRGAEGLHTHLGRAEK